MIDLRKAYLNAAFTLSPEKTKGEYVEKLVKKERFKAASDFIEMHADDLEFRDRTKCIFASSGHLQDRWFKENGNRDYSATEPDAYYGLMRKALELSKKYHSLENTQVHMSLNDHLNAATRARDIHALKIVLEQPEAVDFSITTLAREMKFTMASGDPRIKKIEHRKMQYDFGDGAPELFSLFQGFIREHYDLGDPEFIDDHGEDYSYLLEPFLSNQNSHPSRAIDL